jgi:hypothetical protein
VSSFVKEEEEAEEVEEDGLLLALQEVEIL